MTLGSEKAPNITLISMRFRKLEYIMLMLIPISISFVP